MELSATQQYYRPLVPLELIIISDEDDHTSVPPNIVRNLMDDERDSRMSLDIHSIVTTSAPYGDPENLIGEAYIELSEAYGQSSKIIDINSPDWTPTLDDIAENFTYLEDDNYYLSYFPVADTIEVYYLIDNVTIIVNDWIYDVVTNSIYSEFLSYQTTGTAQFKYIKRGP
jgi:hypothetical protein